MSITLLKKYAALFVAFALAGLPVLVVHADEGSDDRGDGSITQGAEASSTAAQPLRFADRHTTRDQEHEELEASSSEDEASSSELSDDRARADESIRERAEHLRDALEKRIEMLESDREEEQGNATSTAARERNILRFADHLDFLLGTSTPAHSFDELEQDIEDQQQELESLAASSTSREAHILEHASTVSVAVRALLAAQDLVGTTTGARIAAIAHDVNDSLASSTAAEAQIESRGFWRTLFFGGDRTAAQSLSDIASENQDRIRDLTDILDQASTTVEVKAALTEQVQKLQEAQAALDIQAKRERNLWGLFSWRLF